MSHELAPAIANILRRAGLLHLLIEHVEAVPGGWGRVVVVVVVVMVAVAMVVAMVAAVMVVAMAKG